MRTPATGVDGSFFARARRRIRPAGASSAANDAKFFTRPTFLREPLHTRDTTSSLCCMVFMLSTPLRHLTTHTATTITTMTQEATDNSDENTFMLYLIRHGEALHNTLDKLAQEEAKKEAEEAGLGPEEVKRCMKEAQKAVLEDDSLFDAPLSEAGKKEAETARETLQELQQKHGLAQEVLVSPLQRAMQTADIIFPECDNIHVREDLRERKTGRACDERQRARTLAQRNSFSRFSMVQLRTASLTESMLEELKAVQLDLIEEDEALEREGGDRAVKVEEKPMLRKRTRRLARFLMDSDSKVFSVVTHKAFLRELERGTFGKKDATEFGNCEVRVYKLKLKDYDLSCIERVA